MDESVALFNAEQKRLKAAGAPERYLRKQIFDNIVTLAIISVTMVGLFSLLSRFPRNPNHSMKLVIYGPILVAVAIIAGLMLKSGKVEWKSIRRTCWFYIALALIAISVGLIDMWGRTGS